MLVVSCGPLGVALPFHRMTPKLFVGEGSEERALRWAYDLLGSGERDHPDLWVLVPERGELGIDRVRELALWARYGPVRAPNKVAVLGPGERISREAANALLKMLEDTPPHLALVLFAAAPDRVLPTVRSRCLIVRGAWVPGDVAARLRHVGYAEEEVAFLGWLLEDQWEEAEGFLGSRRQPLEEWAQAEAEFKGASLPNLAALWSREVGDPLRRRALGWALARGLFTARVDEALAVGEQLAQGGAASVGLFCSELARFLGEGPAEALPGLRESRRLAWARKASLARGELEDNANPRLLAEVMALWPRRS